MADGTAFEAVIGTRPRRPYSSNARDNVVFGSDPLDERAELAPLRATNTQWVLLDFDSETELGEHVYSGGT